MRRSAMQRQALERNVLPEADARGVARCTDNAMHVAGNRSERTGADSVRDQQHAAVPHGGRTRPPAPPAW